MCTLHCYYLKLYLKPDLLYIFLCKIFFWNSNFLLAEHCIFICVHFFTFLSVMPSYSWSSWQSTNMDDNSYSLQQRVCSLWHNAYACYVNWKVTSFNLWSYILALISQYQWCSTQPLIWANFINTPSTFMGIWHI